MTERIVRPATESAGTPPAGLWLAASTALRRPIPVDQPYPHICGARPISPLTGKPVRLDDRNCAACHPAWIAAPAGQPCAADCGSPLDPAATTDGHTTHPGCTPANPARRQIVHGRRAA